eukprot:6199432-Pleurochrysis_carterae.AAC.2
MQNNKRKATGSHGEKEADSDSDNDQAQAERPESVPTAFKTSQPVDEERAAAGSLTSFAARQRSVQGRELRAVRLRIRGRSHGATPRSRCATDSGAILCIKNLNCCATAEHCTAREIPWPNRMQRKRQIVQPTADRKGSARRKETQ